MTTYGDKITIGGGKVLRDGMAQHPLATSAEGVLDTVITKATVVDASGIYKADVGLRDGRIAAMGKAGNPSVMDGVSPGMIVSAGDVQVAIHTDTLNEIGFVEETIRALAAAPSTPITPKVPAAARHPTSCESLRSRTLPSSTNPTRPYTVDTRP